MSPRSHLCLRTSAVVLLLLAAVWPRGRAGTPAVELAQTAHARAPSPRARIRPQTAAAKLVSAPGAAKIVVAEADDSDLTN